MKKLLKKRREPASAGMPVSGVTWREGCSRFCRNKVSVAALIVLSVIVFCTIFAPLLTKYEMAQADFSNTLSPPSREHIFGTDNLGRDTFTRVLYGGRTSLLTGLVAILIAATLGGALGIIAGYFGGRIDSIIMRFCDVLSSIPALLLALSILAVIGNGTNNVMYAIGASAIPGFLRFIRAATLSVACNEYIEASRALGVSHFGVIAKHVLHNVAAPAVVQITTGMADAILISSTMGYLGLGVQVPIADWGYMVYLGREYLRSAWHLVVFPGTAIALTILSLNLIGDGLRDALDSRMPAPGAADTDGK